MWLAAAGEMGHVGAVVGREPSSGLMPPAYYSMTGVGDPMMGQFGGFGMRKRNFGVVPQNPAFLGISCCFRGFPAAGRCPVHWCRLNRAAAKLAHFWSMLLLQPTHMGGQGQEKAFSRAVKVETSSSGQKMTVQKKKTKQALLLQISRVSPTWVSPGCHPCCHPMSHSILPALGHHSCRGVRSCSPRGLTMSVALGKH